MAPLHCSVMTCPQPNPGTWKHLLALYSVVLLTMTACSGSSDNQPAISQDELQEDGLYKEYTVARIDSPAIINSVWDKEPWDRIVPLRIEHHMGDDPDHRPGVQAKIAYDDEAVYVIYRVEDQYIRCAITDYQGPVFRDSCVEFFFTPSENLDLGYFNLEMNCIGTALFHFQRGQGENRERSRLERDHFDQIEVAHSIDPELVATEMEDPLIWTLEYRIPFDILTEYADIERPASGVRWRANFYKCADDTSHPHWLTWSVVDLERPNFHRPDYFGTLIFE